VKRLDFTIAGAQKCGTTSLYGWLTRHGQIGMSEPKELHFFDDEERDWTQPDYTALHAALPDGRQVCGEATPITFYWVPAQHRLRSYNPECKLILIFRDPVQRAHSHWHMERGRGREPLEFHDAVRHGRERVANGSEVSGLHRWFSYVERSLYGSQLRHLLTVFPREQLLLLDLTDLEENQARLLAQVTDFLGVDENGFDDLTPVRTNAMADKEELDPATRAYLEELFAGDLRCFQELSGLDLRRWPSYRD
jgi:hypothetical protein